MPHFTDSPSDAVIVSACRTPIGKLRGALSSVRADDLLALALNEAVTRAGVAKDSVDEVYTGCANQAGEDNRNVARMGTLLAGFPHSVPGVTVNRLCASGLEAIVQASRAIRTGEQHITVASGVENMTRAPWSMMKPDAGFPTGAPAMFDTALGWRFPNPKMEALFPLEQMGETAENLVEEMGISRNDQDAFAVRSHTRANAAKEAFAREIVAVAVAQKKGDAINVTVDECPRGDTSMAALEKLKPAFKKNGSVTAGNSSSLNDGAAALVLTSRAMAERLGLRIRAVVRGAASAGVSPRTMGIGPVPAVQKLLALTGLSLDDVDRFELNEAFAAQSLAVVRKLGMSESMVDERVNVRGGAIALGHPLGCSGARITTTLLHVLEDQQLRTGIATLCVGVGQGLAVLIERQ